MHLLGIAFCLEDYPNNDASRLSPGTYIYRLTTELTQVQQTFVVVR